MAIFFRNLTSILLFSIFGTSVFFSIEVKPANAAGYVTYKISNISQDDINNYCKNVNKSYGGTRAVESKSVRCYRTWAYESSYVNYNEICDYKHPGYDTWSGESGKSCYDSYWRWW
jgi:hypothetical protein